MSSSDPGSSLYYLRFNASYYTITPYNFWSNSRAIMNRINGDGGIGDNWSDGDSGVLYPLFCRIML